MRRDFFARIGRMRLSSFAMTLPPVNSSFRVSIHRIQGCYLARVMDLPGCYSRGASEVEALENARSAIRAYLWLAQVLAADPATVQIDINA